MASHRDALQIDQLEIRNLQSAISNRSPRLRTNFHRANVGRTAPRIRISQKASAAEADRRIVGNCRSSRSAERRSRRATTWKSFARIVDAIPTGNLWGSSRYFTFSVAHQNSRRAGEAFATGTPTREDRQQPGSRTKNRVLVRRRRGPG